MNKTKQLTLLKIESNYADAVAEGYKVKLYRSADVWTLAGQKGKKVEVVVRSEDNNEVDIATYDTKVWKETLADEDNKLVEYTGKVTVREMDKDSREEMKRFNEANNLLSLLGKFN
jgi:predicted secreted protein